MPELPEVETVANGVNERVHGQTIESAWFSSKPEPFKTPAEVMAEQLPGRTIERVRRVGKHIVFDLGPPGSRSGASNTTPSAKAPVRRGSRKPLTGATAPVMDGAEPSAQWLVHLGMTGMLLVCSPDTPQPPHTHAVLRLSSGKELRFVDARRFGRLELLLPAVPAETPGTKLPAFGFRGPGSEPLTISPADFIKLFKGRRLSIKTALLNQKLLHGVGNIYADESLFRAGIRPKRMAGRITRQELLRLHTALVDVLQAAIALGGSSVSDYVDADGVKGFFQLEHRVYQRTGQPCLVCGQPIRRIVLGGRSTHYCVRCQH